MGFDKAVHSRPEFYQRKLDAISAAKRLVYKLLFVDRHVTRQRQALERANREALDKHVRGSRVLEVGCGRGSFLQELQSTYGCECHGIDVSPEMIEYALAHHPGPTYGVHDSAALPFEDKRFDFVIFTYVLHHVDDLGATIKEARRVGRHVIIYESCAYDAQPLKALSKLYWRLVDGGKHYKSLNEWRELFGGRVAVEIRGRGLVRYGMCIFQS